MATKGRFTEKEAKNPHEDTIFDSQIRISRFSLPQSKWFAQPYIGNS